MVNLNWKTMPYMTLLICGLLCAPALADDFVEKGKKLYESKQFDQAKQYLEMAIRKNPADVTAHYLLGNVFVALKQDMAAKKEYQKAQQLGPNSPAGKYSQIALNRIVYGGCASDATTYGEPAASNLGQINSAAKISIETKGIVQQQQLECTNRLNEIVSEAKAQANRLAAEMQQKIADNGPAQYARTLVPRRGGGYREELIKTYDPEPDNQVIREEYTKKVQNAKERAMREAEEVVESYKQKGIAVEDSALALEKSYVNDNNSIILNPKGTDIYNRNYQTVDTPSGNPVPMMAAPRKSLPSLKPDDQSEP